MDHVTHEVARFPQVHRRLVRALVGSGDLIPHAALNVDVRWHVAGVRNLLRDVREHIRGRQRQRCVDGVVKGVDRVVRGAWMARIAGHELKRDGAGQHVGAQSLAGRPGGHQQRQGVEGRHLVVVRVGFVECPHRVGVRAPACQRVPLAEEQRFHGGEKATLPFGGRFGETLGGCCSQALQHRPGRVPIPFGDEWMVVAKRFAPMRHGEIGRFPLRGLKLLPCLLPTKAVQDGHAAQEVVLRHAACGGGEADGAQAL